jgi:hypothetical protein
VYALVRHHGPTHSDRPLRILPHLLLLDQYSDQERIAGHCRINHRYMVVLSSGDQSGLQSCCRTAVAPLPHQVARVDLFGELGFPIPSMHLYHWPMLLLHVELSKASRVNEIERGRRGRRGWRQGSPRNPKR